jgi:transcriptional regulator with XRE-family HTH domain
VERNVLRHVEQGGSDFMIRLSDTDLAAYPLALGRELRRRRAARGWTRKDLLRRLPGDISVQTLATYELGTRGISVLRLVSICEALGTTAQELLACTEYSIRPLHAGQINVDLRTLARDTRPELVPAQRWAATRLSTLVDGEPETATLDRPAVEQLARLCGVPPTALLHTLPRPRSAHPAS